MDDNEPKTRVNNNKTRLAFGKDISIGFADYGVKSKPHAARTIKLGTRLHTPSPRGSNQNVVSNFSMTCRGAPMMPGRVLTTPLVMLLTIKEKR